VDQHDAGNLDHADLVVLAEADLVADEDGLVAADDGLVAADDLVQALVLSFVLAEYPQ